LRKVIAEEKNRKPLRLRLVTFGGEGLRPELTDATWNEIRDLSSQRSED
jgi:hypothetical protein